MPFLDRKTVKNPLRKSVTAKKRCEFGTTEKYSFFFAPKFNNKSASLGTKNAPRLAGPFMYPED